MTLLKICKIVFLRRKVIAKKIAPFRRALNPQSWYNTIPLMMRITAPRNAIPDKKLLDKYFLFCLFYACPSFNRRSLYLEIFTSEFIWAPCRRNTWQKTRPQLLQSRMYWRSINRPKSVWTPHTIAEQFFRFSS